MQRRTFVSGAIAGVAMVGAPMLKAQTLPNGPIRIVVGFPPGGGTDALARVGIGRAQKENTGMPVCIYIAGELAGAHEQCIVFQAANRLPAAKTGGLQAGVGGGHEG